MIPATLVVMISDWVTSAAAAALANAPAPSTALSAPGGSEAPVFLTSGWITSTATAALVVGVVTVALNALLARRREMFDRTEKEKERAHVRQLEIGKAASEYAEAVHAFRAAVTQHKRAPKISGIDIVAVRKSRDEITAKAAQVQMSAEPTPHGKEQIDACIDVEWQCSNLVEALVPTAPPDAWEEEFKTLDEAMHIFIAYTVRLKWEITGHGPEFIDPAPDASADSTS